VLQGRPRVSMRLLVVAVLAIAMALPTAASVAAAKPVLADRLEARSICISERGAGDPFKAREFRRLYGGRHPFRRCVRFHVRQVVIERRLELPTIHVECRLEARAAPVEFRLDYPGGVNQCVRLESMP
jgi:hypothetical protein